CPFVPDGSRSRRCGTGAGSDSMPRQSVCHCERRVAARSTEQDRTWRATLVHVGQRFDRCRLHNARTRIAYHRFDLLLFATALPVVAVLAFSWWMRLRLRPTETGSSSL